MVRYKKRPKIRRHKSKSRRSKKKKLNFKFDLKQFPNFIRRIRVYHSDVFVAELKIVGYIHGFERKNCQNFHFILEDLSKGFDPKSKKKVHYLKITKKEFPNFVRKAHIFADHLCIAEIDFRGFLYSFVAKKALVTIHVDRVMEE